MAVNWHGDKIAMRLSRAADRGCAVGVRILEAETLRLIMNTPKTGRLYVTRGRKHQASAPGEPPASDTGRLVNSRTVEDFAGEHRSRLTYRTEYALMLEAGTQKMAPRPFAAPAVANKGQEVREAVEAEIRAEMRAGI